jgi:hypothetical protein
MKIWIAEQNQDAMCYNLISQTKKDLIKELKHNHETNYGYPCDRAYQMDIDTSNLFKLIEHLTSEDGGRCLCMGKIVNEYKIINKAGNFSFKKINR